MKKGIILKSSCIFDSVSDEPFAGSIKIEDGRITRITRGNTWNDTGDSEMEVLDCKDKTICAGFGDNHTFFTGYYIDRPGVFEEMAGEMRGYLSDHEKVKQTFCDYMKMLNSHGITSIKEMTFDDSYGLKEIFAELEQEKKLTLRVHFMSQPVQKPMDLAYGKTMSGKYHSDFLAFSGFNQMTDGLIVAKEGDLILPYEGSNSCCEKAIDYAGLKEQVLAADREGMRYTLHAEGDGAFHKILDMYEECEKDPSGKLKHRHGITDLELTSKADRNRMAKLGVFGEAYLQMLMTDDADNWISDVTGKVGTRFGEYLNMRAMADAGVVLAGATDLPFMIPDIPQSIYHHTYANAAKGTGKVNPQNSLTLPETLKSWTIGSQYAMEREDRLGSIEEGKLADLVVFDRNLFDTKEEDLLDVKVEMTIVEGKIVYNGEK